MREFFLQEQETYAGHQFWVDGSTSEKALCHLKKAAFKFLWKRPFVPKKFLITIVDVLDQEADNFKQINML